MVLRAFLQLSPDPRTLTVPRGPTDWKNISTLSLGTAGQALAESPAVSWIRDGYAPSPGNGGVRLSKIVSQFAPLMRRIGFVPLRNTLADLMEVVEESAKEQGRGV
jgi:hypothetical protein